MKTLTLKAAVEHPTMYMLEISLLKGRETERQQRYPRYKSGSCWKAKDGRKRYFGILCQLKPRSPWRVLISEENKPLAFARQSKADKIARWLTDPLTWKTEWDVATTD